MLRFFKFLFIILLVLMITLAGLLFVAIESQPLVIANSSQQVDEADSVKALMSQISDSFRNRSERQTIELNAVQLNSLVGFAQRAHQHFNGVVDISAKRTALSASYKLPANPFGQYVNLNINVLPAQGIELEHVKVGGLAIPGSLALSVVTYLADWYTRSDIATQFIAQVENITMMDGVMTVHIQPLDDFLNELNTVKQSMNPIGDEELGLRTAYYLKYLNSLDVAKKSRSQSLAKFIGPVFVKVKERSSYQTAVKENEAAIMALAIFVGHYRFANFVGEVQPVVGKIALPKAPAILAQRVDLNQHFIFSAAIKVLSDQGLSIAVGEFKELMDRGEGGSGYSFVDLSADYAGVKFAQTATEPEKALQLQSLLAGISSETVFFPSISGLPEGFSKIEFKQRFDTIDSPEYLKLINEIHSRVDSLAIHQ
ncbi:hypothetical protein [Paraglaciecola sp. 25GB23A]|uniref:hypothetical protein n=1 Tax=Paraglaciecola sp. 25GB23A TaxID=3156068 RepID=UPI0032AF5F91